MSLHEEHGRAAVCHGKNAASIPVGFAAALRARETLGHAGASNEHGFARREAAEGREADVTRSLPSAAPGECIIR